MEITYTLTPEDVWAFQQFHARRRPLARFFMGLMPVVLTSVWLFLLWTDLSLLLRWHRWYGAVPHFWRLYWAYHQTLLLLLLFYTLFVVYYLWGGRLLYLRRVRGAQEFRDQMTTRLYPDAVLVTTSTQHSRLAWADIREITEGRSHLFLYTGPATAITLPKRAFVKGAGSPSAFVAAARAFKDDPLGALPPADTGEVWPPPPVRQEVMRAPVPEEVPDPPGTVEIACVVRRSDALRSYAHVMLLRPGVILPIAVPLLFAALFLAFFTRMGPAGYALVVAGALLLTVTLIGSHIWRQLLTHYPTRDTALACVSKVRPDAFVYVMPSACITLPWRDVSAITLVGGDLRLWRKDGLGAYFIPRSAFQSPAEARAALEVIRRCQREAQASPAAPSTAR